MENIKKSPKKKDESLNDGLYYGMAGLCAILGSRWQTLSTEWRTIIIVCLVLGAIKKLDEFWGNK